MKKQEHTPGPWKIIIDGTQSGRWPFIVPVDAPEPEDSIAELDTVEVSDTSKKRRVWKRTPKAGEIEANAHLISAAPDLLAACQAALDSTPCQYDHHGLCQAHRMRTNDAGEPECEQALIRAAISKATPHRKG